MDKARDKYRMGSVPSVRVSNAYELKERGKKYDLRLKVTMNKMFQKQ